MRSSIDPIRSLLILVIPFFLISCGKGEGGNSSEKGFKLLTKKDEYGNEYKMVTNDPFGARIYELENGLKVYLSKDTEEPRVQTLIAVRAGSASEQRETTGLAHYLEHMMFKGSDKMGTLDWEKEKPLLDSISALYELRRKTEDSSKRRRIYKKIDSLSQEAAKYAVPNEYDKIISTLGGQGTNAFTSKDRTVYLNDIPSNEIERWVKLERERFRKMVLRLFHTELETVFEEFNRGQDSDFRKARKAFNEAIFQGHPYSISTIGKPKHLKNPSMVNVHAFKDEFYVPNNMAICMSGDLNPAETFKLIKEYWSDMEPNKDLKKDRDHGKAAPLNGTITRTVQGPESERVYIGYRFPSVDTLQLYVELIDQLLDNNQAGLLNLNLEKKQKVLSASCYSNFYKEYGVLRFFGQATKDQELEDVKNLMLEQIEKIKKGDFPDWMLEAIRLNLRKERIQQVSSNWKAFAFVDAFINQTPWKKKVDMLEELKEITKEDIVAFAKEHLGEDKVIVYKEHGEDTSVVKVPQPPITPVDINRGKRSSFRKEIEGMETERIEPVFVDFKERINEDELTPEVPFKYTENKENELFQLHYILEMGEHHDQKLNIALKYLNKIGTDKYSLEELPQEFYKLATDFDIKIRNEYAYVEVSGLPENLEESIKLMEHVLDHAKADTSAYTKFVDNMVKSRQNLKRSKFFNFISMFNYGMYGPHSDWTYRMSEERMRDLDPAELVDIIHQAFDHPHQVYYHGAGDPDSVKALVSKYHDLPDEFKEIPDKVDFGPRDPQGDSVFYTHYDMVQSQAVWVRRDQKQNKELLPYEKMYDKYYGRGLSSVVFQEIRESKGLAYSASSNFTYPDTGEYHFCYAMVGTQFDKTKRAIDEMRKLLTEMPRSQEQFNASKKNILKGIETERINGTSVFWRYRSIRDKGFEEDPRKMVYNEVKDMTLDDLEQFFNKHIKGDDYDLLIITSRDNVPPEDLAEYGTVKEIDREVLFGF